MIRSGTLVFGVIGHPIRHSLSPVLHNFLIQKFEIDAVYAAFHVLPQDFQHAIAGLKALQIAGFNVTLPHKVSAAAVAQVQAPEVALLGVANTLVNRDGKLHAHLTDPYGFIESLGDQRLRFKDSCVLLIGAGASARSIAFALTQLQIRELVIVNRTPEKSDQLARFIMQHLSLPRVTSFGFDQIKISRLISKSNILVQTTSVGMHPDVNHCALDDFSAINAGHFCYDLIYNPVTTFFLEKAQQCGATVQNGIDMLIYQGLQSLRIWMQQDFMLDPDSLTQLRSLLLEELSRAQQT